MTFLAGGKGWRRHAWGGEIWFLVWVDGMNCAGNGRCNATVPVAEKAVPSVGSNGLLARDFVSVQEGDP